MCLDEAKERMEKAIEHTHAEFGKVRAGKASPAMLDGLRVDYYGAPSPLSNVASVSTPDAKTIMISPWEKNLIPEIEKAIKNSDMGLNPQNNGDAVIINLPPLTEERRKTLVKQVKNEAEHGKISVRNARKEANDMLKSLQKEGAPEDAVKAAEAEVQTLTDTFTHKIDELLAQKEKDIMKV